MDSNKTTLSSIIETTSSTDPPGQRGEAGKTSRQTAPLGRCSNPKRRFNSPRKQPGLGGADGHTVSESSSQYEEAKSRGEETGLITNTSEFYCFSEEYIKTITLTHRRSKEIEKSIPDISIDMSKVFTTTETPPYLTEHFFSFVKHKDKEEVVAYLTSGEHSVEFCNLMLFAGEEKRRLAIQKHALKEANIEKSQWHSCWAQVEVSFVEQILQKQKAAAAPVEGEHFLGSKNSPDASPDRKLPSEAKTAEKNIPCASLSSSCTSSPSSSPFSRSSQSSTPRRRRASYPGDLPERFPHFPDSVGGRSSQDGDWHMLPTKSDQSSHQEWCSLGDDGRLLGAIVSGIKPESGVHQQKVGLSAQEQVLGATDSEDGQIPGGKPGKSRHQEKDRLGAQGQVREATGSEDGQIVNPEWGSEADRAERSQKAYASTKQSSFSQSCGQRIFSSSLREGVSASQKRQGATERVPENCPEPQEGDSEPSYESKRAVSPPVYTYDDGTNREDDRSSNQSAPSHTYILNQLFVHITPNPTADYANTPQGETQPEAQEPRTYADDQTASADRAMEVDENSNMPTHATSKGSQKVKGQQQPNHMQAERNPGKEKKVSQEPLQTQSSPATGLKKPTEKLKPVTKSWLQIASQAAGENATVYRYISKPCSKLLPEKAVTETRWYNRWAKKGLSWFKLMMITLNTIAVRRILIVQLSKTALRVWAVQWVALSLALMLAVCLWMSFRWVQKKWAQTTTKQPNVLRQSHLSRALVVAIDTAKKVLSLQESASKAIHKLSYVSDAVASSSLDDFGEAIERRYPKSQGQVPIKDRQAVEVSVDEVNKTYTLELK